MNLIIDIGNTTAKAALFDGGDIVEERRYGSLTTADTESILTDHPHIEAAILCSVGSYDKGVDELLSGSIARFVQFGAETPVQSMRDCSVVTAAYELGGGMRGTIGIVGPKRMDYDKVVGTLRTIQTQLDELYRKDEQTERTE